MFKTLVGVKVNTVKTAVDVFREKILMFIMLWKIYQYPNKFFSEGVILVF